MNIPEIMDKIGKCKTTNKLERKGIFRDLGIIVQKIEKGEYKKGFISANKFDIVSRTEALFREMEFLMQLGHDWKNILKALPLKKNSKIVDLCPGYTPKIELGLYYLNFCGKIHILDKDVNSIKNLDRFISLFNPKFKIIKKQENLFGPKKTSYDLVLGNHIVDDLVVYYFTNKSGIKLQDYYAQEEIAIEVWKNILAQKTTNLVEVSEKIANIFENITKPKGIICLSQYKSYTEKLFDLSEAYKFNKETFKCLKSILEKRGFLSRNDLNSKIFTDYKGHFGKNDCVLLQKYDHKTKRG